jgi:type IV pilus assembly protein PilP
MMRRDAIKGFVGGVLMLLLTGGSGADRSWAAEVKAVSPAAPNVAAAGPGATATSPPAAVPEAPSAYRYNPAGKSDPFLPFVEIDLAVKKEKEKRLLKEDELKKKAAVAAAAGSPGRPISPLQQAAIAQFRLVGIAGDAQKRIAIVEDGVAKRFYPLFVGTYIGPNGGRIVSILPDRLIVEERFQEEQSHKAQKVQTRRITVMLRKEDEEKP